MRNNVETRRCGCGLILGLREGCPRCAATERARLHAAGVAGREDAWRAGVGYDNGTPMPEHREVLLREERALDEARTRRELAGLGTTANSAAEPPKFDFKRLREACDRIYRKPIPTLSTPDPRTKAGSSPLSQACAAAEEARRLTGVVPYAVATPSRPEAPYICWPERKEVPWFDPSVDCNQPVHMNRTFQCYWEPAVCPDGRGFVMLERDGSWWTWRVVDGVIVFDEAERMVREHGPEFRRVYLGTREDGSPVYTNARGMPSRTPEPPPVGAEVEYAVAESDMRRRQEARYTCGRYPGNSYCHREEGLRVDWKNGQEFIEPYHLNIEGDRWTRLPDATTVPEIGVEVSWEVAKADMMARSEARYDYRVLRMTAVGVEYALIGGRLVTRGNGKAWEASILSEAECADPERRWVRLA